MAALIFSYRFVNMKTKYFFTLQKEFLEQNIITQDGDDRDGVHLNSIHISIWSFLSFPDKKTMTMRKFQNSLIWKTEAKNFLKESCVHEIGHALGLHHEQKSYLHHDYIRINFQNVMPGNPHPHCSKRTRGPTPLLQLAAPRPGVFLTGDPQFCVFCRSDQRVPGGRPNKFKDVRILRPGNINALQ